MLNNPNLPSSQNYYKGSKGVMGDDKGDALLGGKSHKDGFSRGSLLLLCSSVVVMGREVLNNLLWIG